MTDTTTDDRLRALQQYVVDQTTPPLPAPPTAVPGSFADEASRAYEYRFQRRLADAREQAAADQAQAELERPQRERRQAQIDSCVQLLIAEERRHERAVAELSARRSALIHAPLGRRVAQ